jgi:dienelactone hydrolase
MLRSLFVILLFPVTLWSAEPPTGLQSQVNVENATRLPWEFAASSFGPDAVKLKDYDSRKQSYQLFVPKNYDKSKSWPMVVFISPGDAPVGWKSWQKVCEPGNILYCEAYRAGNNCPVGERTRIVLDMLDDVRRHYRVDPDETYLTGFSGGGRMACTIAFSLPEYFGGLAPICGTNPPHRLSYLNHRAADRLSVALVTGEDDFNRAENEDHMNPLLQANGVRTKLWVVPKSGHTVPSAEVLSEVQKWLAEDLKRRRADAKTWPGLAASSTDVPSAAQMAKALFDAAEIELKKPERTWRGVALLQGTLQRFGESDAAKLARKRLDEITKDEKALTLVAEQGGAEERRTLVVQGQAMEKLGDVPRALQAYLLLAKDHAETPEGKKAENEVKRLLASPFLGVSFGGGLKVQAVMPKAAGDLAGLKRDDVLTKLGAKKLSTMADFREALKEFKTGDKTTLEVQRGGKAVTLSIEFVPIPMD